MFKILGIILFLFLFFLIIGAMILFKILNFLGIGKKRNNNYYRTEGAGASYSSDEGKTSSTIVGNTNRKKVFDKSEGDYIDFEDV